MKTRHTKSDKKLGLSVFLPLFLVAPISSSFAITIDNDIPRGTLNHWAVEVLTGGQSRLAYLTANRDASGDIYTENVLFDYFSYVDVGNTGGGFQLSGTNPTLDPEDPDTAISSGSFIGENGNTINWSVLSSIPDGKMVMTNRFLLWGADGSRLGRIRFLQYMDEDVEGVSDDVFFTKGTLVGRNLQLFTVDGREIYGVSHSGVFDVPSGLDNATFAGWAADIYDRIQPRIRGAGQQVGPEGIINNLPTYNHPKLGTVLGPRDVVSVFAWDVDPNAHSAVILTTLGGLPDLGSIVRPPEIPAPGEKEINSGGCINIIDPSKPTIVLTHGLQKRGITNNDMWTGCRGELDNPAASLIQDYISSVGKADAVNIVQYVWHEANTASVIPLANEYIVGRKEVYDAGEKLAQLLLESLGNGYNKGIHFIGHSLGTAVNTYAARMFFSRAPNVTTAQFTILDYPNHILKILGMSPDEEDQWGFDPNFFATALPVARSGLNLKIDNYYSLTNEGVGDEVNGPVYNHRASVNGLEDPHNVGGAFFPDENVLGYDNDHSGVHQWYRWTMNPNGFGTDYCYRTSPFTPLPNFFLEFDDSLDPCIKGWYWALFNREEFNRAFPRNNGRSTTVSTDTILELDRAKFLRFGCDLVTDTRIQCIEASSPFGVVDVIIPEDAQYVSFDYRFLNIGDGDYAAVLIDDTPIWVLSGLSAVEEGVFSNTGPIPLGALKGNRKLTIALYGVNAPNAEFEVDNFKVFSVAIGPLNQPPIALCQDRTVSANDSCQASASVNNGSYDSDGDPITLTQSPPGPYGLGDTLVTLTATDPEGASASCTGTVTVKDTTAPVISSVTASPNTLWPPNHKMVSVKVTATTSDNCTVTPVCTITSVTSNEPDNGLGDGDTANDIVVTGDLSVNLRAERSGTGNGRVYTVNGQCADAAGNSAPSWSTAVTVPHDKGK